MKAMVTDSDLKCKSGNAATGTARFEVQNGEKVEGEKKGTG